MKKLQSKSAQKILIKVRLRKVKRFCIRKKRQVTTETRSQNPVFNQGAVEILKTKSAENFSSRVRLKNENQSLVDPDRFFNRDHDRDQNFKIKAWLKKKNQSLLEKFQARSGDRKLSTCPGCTRTAHDGGQITDSVFQSRSG